MPEPAPNSELLPSLGRLVRGLSALFWGLPITLVICVQSAKTDILHSFNILPAVLATLWMAYPLWEMGHFQKQERIWINALDHAKLLAIINVGLSPFLFWWNQRPEENFYMRMVVALAVCGLAYLSSLNLVLLRLSAMLPDETLRQETKYFTSMNRCSLLFILVAGIVIAAFLKYPYLAIAPTDLIQSYGNDSLWLLVFLALLPVAMTMALIWKIKEAILQSVFGPR